MSTTTQILFNSPALHSLKRDQLVKLCKIHSIKASGKNVELIQKLKKHAETLPKDSPLSIAARSESDGAIPIQAQALNSDERQEEDADEEMEDETSHHGYMPRQSEQWEMVMDSIQEEEEGSSQGTFSSQRTFINGSTGEFGTGSTKASSVGSSIKALATSLGLKRGNSKVSTTNSNHTMAQSHPQENDELSLKSTPYASLPEATDMPQTDHFTLEANRMSVDGEAEIPLPGHALRPGLPAPSNARLSMGYGLGAPSTPSRQSQATTTIRLVNQDLLSGDTADISYGETGTPQLKPFKTTFDLCFSPAPRFGGTSVWPPRNDDDIQMKGIYPKLTFDDLPPSMPASPVAFPAKSPEPFKFGSPLPKNNVSDEQFRSAAAAVLEEMNQRLREDGVDELELEMISKLHPGAKKELPREIKPIPASKRGEITDKFQKLHEHEFQKMQGIDAIVKKRAERSPEKKDEEKVVIGRKRKSNALERDGGAAARRPSTLPGRVSATRVISNGRRDKIAIPGAFGMDDDDDDDEEESEGSGKRLRMDPDAKLTPEEEQKQEEEELRRAEEMEKEKEAIRKKLEANRARRRSSAAHGAVPRKSVGRPRPSVLQKPKPKPSRFGFLSSAKTLVQSVWNRGKPAEAGSTAIPKTMPAKIESAKGKEKMGPPPSNTSRKAAPAPARPSTSVASGSKPPVRVSNAKDNNATVSTKASIASSARARSPLPSFNNSSSRNSTLSNGTTRTNRSSLLSGPASRASSVAGTAASRARASSSNISSVGTRASSRLSSAEVVSSMGSKKVMSTSSIASRKSTAGTSTSRLSVASRLLAPTASSLAKTHRNSKVPSSSSLKPHPETRNQSPAPTALGMITNNPSVTSPKSGTPHNTFSPRRGGIFSTPLKLPSQSGIPTPVKKRTTPSGGTQDGGAVDGQEQSKPVVRSLNGRKPRISRSKVIAKLASQRAASNRVVSGSSAAGGRPSGLTPRVSGAKTRSSIGAKVSRASYGGGSRARPSAGGAGNVLLSAKKRARQSEYARRRSRVGPLNFETAGGEAGASGVSVGGGSGGASATQDD
ncbi:hypothetical protein BDN70DRAFT_988593 [Pholiota conissans]|uniref:SAP domain-containing protein n=1 Tax=Pholiota conissans TaxID=109636 RepID=A0A9P6CZW1_9AGAR|nr:hypothetical protein BDN70DRAFT_988593 [Pholiota conissans]